MKVIDLLNKIAKGEEVPKEIMLNKEKWIYYGQEYINPNARQEEYKNLFGRYNYGVLNDEIEKIEDKEIEELNLKDGKVIGTWENGSEYCYTLSAPQVVIIKKINELVKAVNSLKEIK